ncbi:isocitrate/isopropylmalate family dehydrogenase [Megasphaera paucivorans]
MEKHIVVIPGDGIGKEITTAAVKVLKKIDEIYHIGLTFEYQYAGERPMINLEPRFLKIRLRLQKKRVLFYLVQ